jgi:hypothetical protein
MEQHEAPRPTMNCGSQMQARGTEVTAMAMAMPAPMPAPMALKAAMLEARDALMIISYQLIIRVLFLARRWNY